MGRGKVRCSAVWWGGERGGGRVWSIMPAWRQNAERCRVVPCNVMSCHVMSCHAMTVEEYMLGGQAS